MSGLEETIETFYNDFLEKNSMPSNEEAFEEGYLCGQAYHGKDTLEVSDPAWDAYLDWTSKNEYDVSNYDAFGYGFMYGFKVTPFEEYRMG